MVIDERQASRALGSVHSGFYLSPHTVSIGLIGPGLVGGALLEQIGAQIARLGRDFRLDLRVRGIMSSQRMLLSDAAIPLDAWKKRSHAARRPTSIGSRRTSTRIGCPMPCIIDCSASADVAELYPRLARLRASTS